MRQNVTTFKTLKYCLKEMQKFVLDGKHLESGKPLDKFGGLRSREILGCWVIAAMLNHVNQSERIKICTDPNGGDGILYNIDNQESLYIEQVMVSYLTESNKTIEEATIEEIIKKQKKVALHMLQVRYW